MSSINLYDEIRAIYEVANGEIEDPSIEIEVGGESTKFSGRDARIFAFGMLAGLKATRIDGFKVESNLVDATP